MLQNRKETIFQPNGNREGHQLGLELPYSHYKLE
jgi:hypothetical protein